MGNSHEQLGFFVGIAKIFVTINYLSQLKGMFLISFVYTLLRGVIMTFYSPDTKSLCLSAEFYSSSGRFISQLMPITYLMKVLLRLSIFQ